MFLFLTSELLTKAEMRVVKRHFAWEAKNIPKDQIYNKIKVSEELKDKHELRKQSINEIAEACISRELGLKKYSVIRYRNMGKHTIELMFDRVELIDSAYDELVIGIFGYKLRQNGTIGLIRDSIALRHGFIEKRMLDGSWHSIIPTNPIWTED